MPSLYRPSTDGLIEDEPLLLAIALIENEPLLHAIEKEPLLHVIALIEKEPLLHAIALKGATPACYSSDRE